VHELVGALVERGYLRPAPASSSRYVLGVKAFELGGAYERGFDLVASGRAAARRIAAECGETAQMVIRDGRHVIYVAKVDSTHSIRMVSHVGGRLPTWCTAVGKVMLASLPPEELDALFPDDSALIPMTARSITTKRRLLQELEITRARGWGRESGESNDDVTCVAAPVYDRRGACVAAISISVPNMRWDAAGEPKYAELIVRGAEELSRDLGWLRTPDADASSSGESDPASR
jgi:DNA-binding IclR family transcriptional regulator